MTYFILLQLCHYIFKLPPVYKVATCVQSRGIKLVTNTSTNLTEPCNYITVCYKPLIEVKCEFIVVILLAHVLQKHLYVYISISTSAWEMLNAFFLNTDKRFRNEAPGVTEYKSLYNTTAKSKTISAPLG